MPKLDLKAGRAAREEVLQQDPPIVEFVDGSEHELPLEPPIEVAEIVAQLMSIDKEHASNEDGALSVRLLIELGRVMLGERLYSEFLATTPPPSFQDMFALGQSLEKLYPALGTMGESPASDGSSTTTSSRSRRTSKGSTALTSA